ncbi:MAG TPA: PQQ-binding-like beta-propeller repeat protein [Gemmataceae bacterium]|nr:PQQ-binding-like beta-propeller repeat protein [Gemmataceae bacterium]
MNLTPIVLHFLSASLILAPTPSAENWPQWRGPAGDGISSETNLPTKWSDKDNLAWTFPLPGMGESTPAVWGDRIFLTCQDGDHIALFCISTDGKELWRKPVGPGGRTIRNNEGNGASASPSTDGKHVWVFVGSGELACYDFDGNETWKFNVQERYGKFNIQWGFHCTPLLDGDRLYLQLFHSGGHQLVALNKATGEEVWKVERKGGGHGENRESYASMVVYRKGDQAYLVAHGDDFATAHRLTDGSEIWRVGDLTIGNRQDLRFVASPAVSPDLIVIPSCKNGPVVAVKPEATGMITTGSPAEAWRLAKGTPDVPSPLIHDGLVYLCKEDGALVCLDAKTGEEKYTQRLHSSLYRASPVWADGNLYLTAKDGTMTVVKAGPKFEKIAENTLPDQFQASPAISGGRIYFHGFGALYAVGPAGK